MKIKKIIIEIDEKEISLSLKEAKELRSELNKLFEKKEIPFKTALYPLGCPSGTPESTKFWYTSDTDARKVGYGIP